MVSQTLRSWVLDFTWGGEQLLGDIGDHRPRREVVSARSTTPKMFESLDSARQFQATSKATSKSFKSNPTPIKFRFGRSVLTDRPSICASHSPIEILPTGLTITRNLLNAAIV